MKFTDGFWMARDGVRLAWAAEARQITQTDRGLRLLAPVRRIRHRGDTLNGSVLTVELFSPMRDVIGVRSSHHSGGLERPPSFELATDASVEPVVAEHVDRVDLTSGSLTASIGKHESWSLEFRDQDGDVLTSGDQNSLGIAQTSDGEYQLGRLSLGVGELVYGLGERFTAFVKNGQVVDVWQADGGTSSEQAYKNIPFYLTNRGYGVFVNYPGAVSFEVGSESVAQVQFSVPSQSIEYLVIYGPSPKEILHKYTALTGRPALPPAWSFGLWLSTSFTTSYDEDTVTSFVEEMAEHDIPLSVFHFDCFWMKEYHWCDFTWDPDVFPDPAGMLKRLKARGLRISLWINPYIAQASALFAEGKEHGYLLKRANSDVWQWDLWQPGMGLVDFTNPDAARWFSDKLRVLLDMGVDCFKTDFGERIPTDVVYHDGSDPERMHNYYAQLYNKCVFDLLREVRGEGEAVLFARSATAGGQQFPVHWGGDNTSSYPSMAETLRGGLSLGLSGFGFWSHDIGGFEGTPDPAVFKRWLPFGLLSSHSRLHGSDSVRVPWAFDEQAVEITRRFTKLKHTLMPYLFGAAVTAREEGVPVMRPMLVEFPDDPATQYLDRQYMLGPDLLVAPVFSAEGFVEYYVPNGTWTQLLTGEQVTGPAWQREVHSMDSLPLLVRPGSVIAIGADDTRPDYAYADGVTLRITGSHEGQRVQTTVPNLDGSPAATFTTTRNGSQLQVSVAGTDREWSILLSGPEEVVSVEGGTTSSTAQGTRIAARAETVVVTLVGQPIGSDRGSELSQ
jgi:alpha-D-xyloside xylohydrolase